MLIIPAQGWLRTQKSKNTNNVNNTVNNTVNNNNYWSTPLRARLHDCTEWLLFVACAFDGKDIICMCGWPTWELINRRSGHEKTTKWPWFHIACVVIAAVADISISPVALSSAIMDLHATSYFRPNEFLRSRGNLPRRKFRTTARQRNNHTHGQIHRDSQ